MDKLRALNTLRNAYMHVTDNGGGYSAAVILEQKFHQVRRSIQDIVNIYTWPDEPGAKTVGVHPKFVAMIRELIDERFWLQKRSLGSLGAADKQSINEGFNGRMPTYF